MGGMNHPIYQGEIDGRKIGLEIDLSLFSFIRKSELDLKKFSRDYWIGFGAGYQEGQTIRNSFKKMTVKLSLEEYVDCCQYLFLKTQMCNTTTQDYFDNIENWDKLAIDDEVCQKSLKLLASEKIQKGLNEIFEFYKANFRLKAMREVDNLLEDLKKLRNKKKKEKNYDTSEDKTKIALNLKSLINRYRE